MASFCTHLRGAHVHNPHSWHAHAAQFHACNGSHISTLCSFCGCWYADLADAEEHLAKLQAGHPEMKCSIEVTPLSKAFALSERWVGSAATGGQSVPLKLQASKAELKRLPGFPPLPDELRGAFNPRTGPFPMWQMDELKGVPL